MKILYLTNEFPPHVYGGAGVHLQNLVYALVDACGDVVPEVVKYGAQGHVSDGPTEIWSVPFEQRDGASEKVQMQAHLQWACRVLNLDIAYDVIHCHTWYTLLSGLLLKLLTGKPLVITCHSLDVRRPWKRDSLGAVYNYSRWIEKVAYEAADAVIAVSETVKADLETYFSLSCPVYSIYNGVDHLISASIPHVGLDTVPGGGKIRIPYALFLGRLTEQKGLNYFLDAAECLAEKGVQFVICAGQADSAQIEQTYRQRYDAMCRKGVPVLWLNHVYEADAKAALYRSATVYVNPSVYEPFGLTVAEALGLGTPVVLSSVCGISELLIDGEDCLLVPYTGLARRSDFSIQLAEKILSVVEDDALRQKLSMNGMRKFSTLPSWTTIATQHRDVYKSLLGGTSGPFI